jgi:hypothetical protein
MPELQRCPPPLILQQIRQVLTHFCKETQAWTCDLGPLNVVNAVQDYDLDGEQPSYALIDTVLSVVLAGVPLTPLRDWNITDREDVTLHLVNAPTADDAGGLAVQVCLRPKQVLSPDEDDTIEQVDTRLFQDWYQVWAYGVMGKLMLMPEKAWSNPGQGKLYTRMFFDGIIQARVQQVRGGTNARVRANAPKAYRW